MAAATAAAANTAVNAITPRWPAAVEAKLGRWMPIVDRMTAYTANAPPMMKNGTLEGSSAAVISSRADIARRGDYPKSPGSVSGRPDR